MTSETAATAMKLAEQASRAVKNAKMRSRLRGEHLELVVAGERLDELEELLRGVAKSGVS